MFPFTKIFNIIKKFSDLSRDTHSKIPVSVINKSFININELDFSGLDPETVKYLSEQYLKHRFDLLGSGWTENSYHSNSPGLEGYKYNCNISVTQLDSSGWWLKEIVHSKHLQESMRIWKNIKPPYNPIDWQKDIKSGYRWDAKKWYKNQRDKYLPGADLKMPWEIARFYHLIQLAIFSLIDKKKKNIFIREFHNQVLDFVAANPPRMGVNWTTTMEVAIRATNFLIAYDLFKQIDDSGVLDNYFQGVFTRTIFEHGVHIFHNLEYKKAITSNHYLSNIAGLLFIGSYLPEIKPYKKWLLFSIRELKKESFKQFLSDGVNFESSTAYHSLSASFLLYSNALIFGIFSNYKKNGEFHFLYPLIKDIYLRSDEKRDNDNKMLPYTEYSDLLYKIGKFIKVITKPNHEIPQIGDNDSGRFIKLSPTGKFLLKSEAKAKYLHLKNNHLPEIFWDENILDHTPLLAAFNGLFVSSSLDYYGQKYPLEKSFVESLAGHLKFYSKESVLKVKFINHRVNPELHFKYQKQSEFYPSQEKNISLKENLTLFSFPAAKFFVFRSDRIYLAINAMSNGQNGNGGHAHNDKLSFELSFDGEDTIVDPGTYLYTPLPEKRNLFRSTSFHNTLIIPGKEQNQWKEGISGLFHLSNNTQCDVVLLQKDTIGLTLSYRNIKQMRIIKIFDEKIQIIDFSNLPFYSHFNYIDNYSNGYGKLISYNIQDGDKK